MAPNSYESFVSEDNTSVRSSCSDVISSVNNPFGSFRQNGDFPSSVFGYYVSFSSDTSTCLDHSMNNSTHIYMNLLDAEADLNSTLGPRLSGDGKESTPVRESYSSQTHRLHEHTACCVHDTHSKVSTWLDGHHSTKLLDMSSPQLSKLKKNLKKVAMALHRTKSKQTTLTTLAVL